jgi:two-component system sensor histidine kinase UhpB
MACCGGLSFFGGRMSLRLRLIGLVCLVLLISLALGGAIAYSIASRSVRTEMRAALLVGRHTIENGVERMQTAGEPWPDLNDLVASYEGNRHLRVRLVGAAAATAAPAVEKAALGRVPTWFARSLGVAPERAQIPVAVGGRDYGTIIVETDPYNETLEVWNEFADTLLTLAVFCGLIIILIYVFIGRTLRPVDRLAGALEEIGDGRYRTRIGGRLPLELSRLRDSFNRMAARLAASDAENRRLNEQLLNLQEQERAELARDLHDEVSPYLFAINVDTAAASRLLEENRPTEAGDHIRSIADAVRQMQRQVRQMLGRLRPIGLAEFGLMDAIENLVTFWRRRRPEIHYEVAVSAECEDLKNLIGTTICRIVQEAVSNAVRHAEPKLVTISVERSSAFERECDEITVTIGDDGRGMREPGRLGYGLIGIKERVGALGGRLNFANPSGGGFRLVAVLPLALPTPLQLVEP